MAEDTTEFTRWKHICGHHKRGIAWDPAADKWAGEEDDEEVEGWARERTNRTLEQENPENRKKGGRKQLRELSWDGWKVGGRGHGSTWEIRNDSKTVAVWVSGTPCCGDRLRNRTDAHKRNVVNGGMKGSLISA